MRKNKINLFFTFLFGLTIFSCSNESSEITNTEVSNRITADKLEYVGIEHNIILGEVFEFLDKKTNEINYSNKIIIDKRKDLENFLISRIQSNNNYSKNSKKIALESMKSLSKETQTSSKHNTYSKNTASTLSDVEKQYLDELGNILNNINLKVDIIDIEKEIVRLEKLIEKDDSLSNEQLITLFSATQTAKYTSKYWRENWGKWVDLSSNDSSISLKQLASSISKDPEDDGHNGCNCEAIGNVAKADVAGAVVGATYALAVNLIPGGGQVAYGGAIVGNAAKASVFAAVYEFFDW